LLQAELTGSSRLQIAACQSSKRAAIGPTCCWSISGCLTATASVIRDAHGRGMIAVLGANDGGAESRAGRADDWSPSLSVRRMARVRAALRRSARGAESCRCYNSAGRVDLVRRQARGKDGEVHLTPLEYRVLESLLGMRG
jgi:hypothetical protein